jgi:AbrB family looped-hinge helix DNA binding protein
MSKVVRARKKGQVTIPDEYRKELGIGEDTLLRMRVEDGELRIAPVEVREQEQGSPWLRELYEYFAPVREEILRKGYTEEEVNADIDAAIRAVRAERRGR